MYTEHFGLTALPFSIAPDPRYLYMSGQHREALAHLLYGINSDSGFVLLTGEVGTGKTTVCRCLLEQVPAGTDIAFILNPKVTVEELLASLCDELGIGYPEGNRSIKVFVDRINTYLLDAHAQGHKTVLIIEEAQNLGPDVLEQVRLLTNLETHERKLLQIIMLGQPELREMLSRPELRQLAQRVTARYHLGPLSEEEVAAYVSHRLSVAGARTALFPPAVIRGLHRLSGGIPRVINMICDRALLGAYAQGKDRVDSPTLDQAAREISGISGSRTREKTLRWVMIPALILAFGAALAAAYYSQKPTPATIKPPEISSAVMKPEEPPKLDPLQWPADKPMDKSKDLAFGALFRQWNIPYDEADTDICKQVQTHGLRCLQGPGSLISLMNLNRPAVLKLYDDRGQDFYSLLTAIQGQTARFVVGSETRTVAIGEIEKHWYGEYTLFWKPAPEFRTDIRPESSGPEVQWVNRQLSLIRGRDSVLGDTAVYSNSLVRQVKKFQLARGLVPDGIIGAQTMIHLSNAAGSREPKLAAEPEGR